MFRSVKLTNNSYRHRQELPMLVVEATPSRPLHGRPTQATQGRRLRTPGEAARHMQAIVELPLVLMVQRGAALLLRPAQIDRQERQLRMQLGVVHRPHMHQMPALAESQQLTMPGLVIRLRPKPVRRSMLPGVPKHLPQMR